MLGIHLLRELTFLADLGELGVCEKVDHEESFGTQTAGAFILEAESSSGTISVHRAA